MRFPRYLTLGILTAMLTVSSAQAGGNYGSTLCHKKFSCSETDLNQMESIANDCSVDGFGFSTKQSGIFDGATLDASNCMMGQLPPPASLAPVCCVTAEADTCSMRCTLQSPH